MLLFSVPSLLTNLPLGQACITVYLRTYLRVHKYIIVYVKPSCARNEGTLGGGINDQNGGMPPYILNLGSGYRNDQVDVLANLLTGKESLR